MTINYTSSVLFVRDIKTARAFYEGLLEQKVLMDHGPNVGFEGGFAIWQADHAEEIIFGKPLERPDRLGANNSELYFETDTLDEIWQRLQAAGVQFAHPMREQPWGQRVFRAYDPDGHLVDIGEGLPVVILRFLGQGMEISAVAKRMSMPEDVVRQLAALATQTSE